MQYTLTEQARKRKRRENQVGYAFMLPSLLFFFGFVIFPMGMALVTSFTNYSMTSFDFVGFTNYVNAFKDKVFLQASWNTIVIVLVSVPVVTLFSLWVASVVYKMGNAASSFYRVIFYLPIVLAIAVIALLLLLHKKQALHTLGLIVGITVMLGAVAYALYAYISQTGTSWPAAPQLNNYTRLFSKAALKWLWNTLFICAMAMLLTSVTATMAGYAIAKKRFAGRALIFSIFVMAMALPKQVILIPLLKEMSFLSLHNTPWAVILPTVGWPFGVFLMKQFAENIPGSILEATRIDGAGEIQTFIQIVLPMVAPGIGALAIFTFISTWNDYFLQLLMLNTERTMTISVGIAKLQQEMSTDFGLIMAGAAIAAIPIVLIFLIFQRFFTRGITIGAVKG